ncbi:SPOR domain-containing protein [Vibrio chagasii]|nr:SPOR domain-containing protein [Vibrio chagasii]
MQCGAYKTSAQAEARKLDIAFKVSRVKSVRKTGGSWCRVVLGPYKLKRDAEQNRHKLGVLKI